MWYLSWDDPFPTRDVEVVKRCGALPHLTWELYWPSQNAENARELAASETGLDDVLQGRHNAYIDAFARAGAAYGQPVFIRFLHEFNGNWYVWSGNKNGREQGGPAKVREVWRYVVERCRSQGASNFVWVWCPHGPSIDVSEEPWNRWSEYWPGDDTVDWFGVDFYNWFPRDPWGGERPYRDPIDLVDPVIAECLALARLPIMVAETGSGEFTRGGMNKARWVKGLFDALARHPEVRMLTWFHVKKELDWRVNSSPASLEAFREGAQRAWITDRPEARPQL
jgi:beta-mannanase